MHLICVSAAIRTGPKIERAVLQRMCEGIADCGCRASLFWMSQALQPGESQDCLNVAWSEGPKGDAQDQAGNWKCYHRGLKEFPSRFPLTTDLRLSDFETHPVI